MEMKSPLARPWIGAISAILVLFLFVLTGFQIWFSKASFQIAEKSSVLSSTFAHLKFAKQHTQAVLDSLDQFRENRDILSGARLQATLAHSVQGLNQVLNTLKQRIPKTITLHRTPEVIIKDILVQMANLRNAVASVPSQKDLSSIPSISRTLAQHLGELQSVMVPEKQRVLFETNRLTGIKTYAEILIPTLIVLALAGLMFLAGHCFVGARKETDRLERLLKGLGLCVHDMVVMTDMNAKIQYVSRSTRKTLGYHEHELINHSLSRILVSITPRMELETPLLKQIQDEKIVRDWRDEFRDKRNHTTDINLTAQILTGPHRQPLGFVFAATKRSISTELKEEEQRLDRIKSDFISILSHELRSPLTVVKTALEILTSGFCPENRRDEIMQRAKGGVDRLTRLAHDLTDLANIDSRKFVLNVEPKSIELVVTSAIEKVKPEIEKKQIRLNQSLSDNLPIVRFDFVQTEKVLAKLLENAIKYSAPMSAINVSVDRHDHRSVQVLVADTGCGIPQERLPRILKKFEQAEDCLTRSFDGAGLGLPIANEIVEIQGGKLWLESKIGVGTKVYFTLPVDLVQVSTTPRNLRQT